MKTATKKRTYADLNLAKEELVEIAKKAMYRLRCGPQKDGLPSEEFRNVLSDSTQAIIVFDAISRICRAAGDVQRDFERSNDFEEKRWHPYREYWILDEALEGRPTNDGQWQELCRE